MANEATHHAAHDAMTHPDPAPGGPGGNPLPALGLLAVAAISVWVLFEFGITWMLGKWETPEYNHGYLMPFVALYLLTLKARDLVALPPAASWAGVGVVVLALAINVLGDRSAVVTISEYAMLLAVWGLALAAVGRAGWGLLAAPLLYLLFMVPLPNFLETRLTTGLQLWSSELGVAVIRAAGLSVYLQGNVIDLGSYQLQVAEACSGMRYLFPLMSFGFVCAVLFRGRTWQRAVLFLSTIPITLLMNSFRIGVIGILVNFYGIEQAEGFLHDFEGWAVFMACVGVLFAEVWVFARLEKRRFLEIFGLDIPPSADIRALLGHLRPNPPVIVATAILGVAALVSFLVPAQPTLVPIRAPLATFPMRIGPWQGRDVAVEQVYLDALQTSDYLSASFTRPDDPMPVGVWVAYYDSQAQGASVHSPQACLPGGGWRIESFAEHAIPNVGPDGGTLTVNRVVIALGDVRQLVYYWFPQRGRNITSEFLVKWYIFQDGLTMNRADGALLRLTTFVDDPTNVGAADARLEQFVREADPQFAYFLPGAKAVMKPPIP